MTKTWVPSGKNIERNWWVVDAANVPLGRLAAEVALRLRGKHKPSFTPFIDMGDHVVVVNADKVLLTGRKLSDKVYYRHTGHIGGIKEITAEKLLAKNPERMVEMAIRGMLPKNRIGRRMYTKLRVYRGSDHPHQAQQPAAMEVPSKRKAE